jgi:hypothetical protein
MDDRPTHDRITALTVEEEELWERAGDGDGLDVSQRERLEAIRVELDQYYDVLDRRQARGRPGSSPTTPGPDQGVDH